METVEDDAFDSAELVEVESNTDEAAADSLMSVAGEHEAAGDFETDDFQTESLCPTQGQSCSNTGDCSGLELCLGGTCRCECDFGAWCTSSSQCGFAGFCRWNSCQCY